MRVRVLGDEDVRRLERAGFKTAIQCNSIAPSQTAASSIVLESGRKWKGVLRQSTKGVMRHLCVAEQLQALFLDRPVCQAIKAENGEVGTAMQYFVITHFF